MLRDNSAGGTVQRTRDGSVHVVNKRTKHHFTALPEKLRPMTDTELDSYTAPMPNDHPQVYLRRRLEVIATWDESVPPTRVNGRIND